MTAKAAEPMGLHVPHGLWAAARSAADGLKKARKVVIATHIDADGISAAAIASGSLDRQGTAHEIRFFKKLDDETIRSLRPVVDDLVWYTDLGSGSADRIEGTKAVISDHHVPSPGCGLGQKSGQMALSDFTSVRHVNPQMHGVSGANDLSGAGATFLVALAMDLQNAHLVPLAILGAVGDLQDQRTCRLEGLNRELLALGSRLGLVEATEDIRYFGRETRPVHKMLEYSSDPYIPGITNSEDGAISFLLGLGIELKDGDSWRTWSDLSSEERSKVTAGIREVLVGNRRRPDTIARLTGEVYSFPKEQPHQPVRDAKEFATLLNACGRHGKAEVGLRICAGDRGEGLTEGLALLRDHRSAISQALNYAKDAGVTRLRNIQYFDARDEIEDTIVGTVAGMLLNSNGSDRSAPMVAFADSTEYSETPKRKASARGTQELVRMGLDLSAAMRAAAERVGGVGGGHNIAAGATIPSERMADFLKALDELVESQLVRGGRRPG